MKEEAKAMELDARKGAPQREKPKRAPSRRKRA